jgi:hypothetical protein
MGRVVEPIARETYETTFKRCARALRDAEIPHACMGSLALWALGGPEPNLQQDLDFAVAEEDVDAAREALEQEGLQVQQPPEDWLFKAWSDGVEVPGSALVDIIYRPAGLVVTRERLRECEHRSVLAMSVPVFSATDLLVTKIHSLTEQNADFSSTLQFERSLREQIDRAELERRVGDTPFGKAFLVLVDALGIGPDDDPPIVVERGGSRGADSDGDYQPLGGSLAGNDSAPSLSTRSS